MKRYKKVFFLKHRLAEYYRNVIVEDLALENNFKNDRQVPLIKKIVVHRGLGEAPHDPRLLQDCIKEFYAITGQHGAIRKSKKPIAAFKLRQFMPIGIVVTLRGERMYAFLERLINISLPRIRDFQGLDLKGFDGHGNYSFGIEEQLVFPEIKYDDINKIKGMDITIVTTTLKDAFALQLLKAFGLPFKENVVETPIKKAQPAMLFIKKILNL
uniref:Large ribosomal subunit protein uL5c n=1 Tax=Prototheca cutis TaxID=575411 RepID=A0A2Z6BEQ7_9CHLO|nr:ribosomal protein l5 [Prototheca cutis]BBD20213.1 ribosomal protein l5 [Prototheca cutis]